MKCPRQGCDHDAVVDKTYGILPCLICQNLDDEYDLLNTGSEFVNISKSDRIQHQRDYGAKDLIQPYVGNRPNPEFAQAYPKQMKDYFSKEEIRKL